MQRGHRVILKAVFLSRTAISILIFALGAGCSSASKAVATAACVLPTASVVLEQESGKRALKIYLKNHSPAPLEFDNWRMIEAFIELSATTAGGERLARYVPFETAGFQGLVLSPGESRTWTYGIDGAFPGLSKALMTEPVKLNWSFNLSPLGGDCSMQVTGTANLR